MSHPETDRSQSWADRLNDRSQLLEEHISPVVEGKLVRMVGMTLEATGCQAPIGARCIVQNPDGSEIETEVVGFAGDKLYLMPTSEIRGIVPNARVIPTEQVYEAPAGEALLGRVLDGAGKPIDGKGSLKDHKLVPLNGTPDNHMEKAPIR
ncbi:MAG: flagellum-specific ATP synthase FliI, partial [Gammaproteobacteria bacterium]|nr:flagellum-specific ATP synthase FliI [Gammaproteobacteria bacterium]